MTDDRAEHDRDVELAEEATDEDEEEEQEDEQAEAEQARQEAQEGEEVADDENVERYGSAREQENVDNHRDEPPFQS